ncbi:MAG TPA: alpha/beta fold hydrolase [Cyclobacteriaceae bacterium]
MSLKKKIIIRVAIAIATFVVLANFMSSCLSFRMNESKAKVYYEDSSVSPEINQIKVEGRSINYAQVINGKDNLAVFVHGSPGSWSAFKHFLKADSLIQATDMISIDRPGFGYSDFGKAEPSIKQQAFLMARVLQQYKNKNIILVGHSLGGPVVARMAMDYPGLVGGLVLVAPSVDPEQEKYEWYRHVMKNSIFKYIIPKSFRVSNEEILPLKEELKLMLPYWKDIQTPTIVIQGTNDQLVPKENADFVRKMVPEEYLDVWMIEGMNHFVPWSRPELIAKGIVSCLN